MSSYATIRPTFWARGSGKELRGDSKAQVLALYLMTCQHANVSGIFHIGIPTIAHETGLEECEVLAAFSRLHGIAEYDAQEELCFVPNMAKHQIGEELKPNDKRKPKLLRELQQFNGHRFLNQFFSIYAANYDLPENKGLPETEKPPVWSGKVRSGKVKDPDANRTTFPEHPLTGKEIEELMEFYKVSSRAIAAAVEECRTYWLVGGGAGTRRGKRGWAKTVRTNLKYQHDHGLLKEPSRSSSIEDGDGWNN